MNRRKFLQNTAAKLTASLGTASLGTMMLGQQNAFAKSQPLTTKTQFGWDLMPETIKPIKKSDEEWKKSLSQQQYAVLRNEATERPFSSPLNNEKRKGTFHCAGCDLPLYRSETKFDSGTGWPSYYEAIKDAVGTKSDFGLFSPRIEVHCIRCEGHQGHIFNDGPAPTFNRHCINGVALNFKPDTA